MNPCVRTNSFTVLHPEVEKLPRALLIDKYSRNHQRPEKITLPAFIDTEVRLEHFRQMHLLIAKPRFPENFGLEGEFHEILDPTPLHRNLWPFSVNGHTQLLLLREKDRVRLGRKREPAFL